MPAVPEIYLSNDMILELDLLKDGVTGSFLNAATVQATITDHATGNAITNITNPVTLSFVAGSSGKYRATLAQDAAFTVGQKVLIVITAVEAGVDGRWRFVARAKNREIDE